MRERAVLEWGMRGRDPEKNKSSSLFAETVVPNLLIPSCIYNLNPIFRTTFAKLMLLMTQREYAHPLLFVHLPPNNRAQTQHLPVRLPRECQCQCYCKCHGCSKDCLCKCPPGCSHCAEQRACRCKSEAVVLALTGHGPGQQTFLHLQWCDEATSSQDEHTLELEANIQELLLAKQEGREPNSTTHGQLLPLLPSWREKSAVAIQAAYRMHLHKGLLDDANLERQRLKRGESILYGSSSCSSWNIRLGSSNPGCCKSRFKGQTSCSLNWQRIQSLYHVPKFKASATESDRTSKTSDSRFACLHLVINQTVIESYQSPVKINPTLVDSNQTLVLSG